MKRRTIQQLELLDLDYQHTKMLRSTAKWNALTAVENEDYDSAMQYITYAVGLAEMMTKFEEQGAY